MEVAKNLVYVFYRGCEGIRGVRQLRELLACVTRTTGIDEELWRWNDKGLFTVKSTYKTISDRGIRAVYVQFLWGLRMPLCVKILMWLILKRRLLTTDMLMSRGWMGNTLCVLCGCNDETIDHIFVRCVFSQFVLGKCNGVVWLQEVGNDVRSVWERLMTTDGYMSRAKHLYFLSAVWSMLWTIRNKVIFGGANIDSIYAVRWVNRDVLL